MGGKRGGAKWIRSVGLASTTDIKTTSRFDRVIERPAYVIAHVHRLYLRSPGRALRTNKNEGKIH